MFLRNWEIYHTITVRSFFGYSLYGVLSAALADTFLTKKANGRQMKINIGIGLLLLMLAGCRNFDYSAPGTDVPTAGRIAVGIDQGDSFLMTEEIDYFQREYTKATLVPHYLCEVSLLRQLQLDSLRFVVMNRDFTAQEKENLERRDIKVRSVKIAESSIAIIVNKQCEIDSISQDQLKAIMLGKFTQWESGNTISLVFDGACGSNYNYFAKEFLKARISAPKLGAFDHPKEVIEYVSAHSNAVGVIALNWIADRTDSLSKALVGSIKVLKVENVFDHKYYFPFQSQIKAHQYPFVQQIFMHDLQGYNGLANGFIAFVASQPGQILVKKSGLIPAKDHGRTIVIETE